MEWSSSSLVTDSGYNGVHSNLPTITYTNFNSDTSKYIIHMQIQCTSSTARNSVKG